MTRIYARLAQLLLGGLLAATSHAEITHIEPPNWWVGMHHSQLQLLVHGDAIAAYDVRTDAQQVHIARIERTDNPNYLFVTLDIAHDAQPQTVALHFSAAGQPAQHYAYPLRARKPGSANRQGFSARDTLYLITPDRFANGDANNDTQPALADGLDRNAPFGRHGGDLQGIIDQLDYLQALGITQLWLNPVVENAMPASSYHGYAATHLYRIDPRYGDNALYRTLSEKARAKGIGLIIDLVPNHIGAQHPWMTDLPAHNWINNSAKFVPTNHMRESLQDPHSAIADRQAFTDGWFVPSMPDLNQREPLLATYLTQNAIWWIESADLSGIRVDTWSYSDKTFLQQWTRAILQEYPRLNIVGEEWSTDPNIIAYWQAGQHNPDGYSTALPSLFDFPLQESLIAALKESESWNSGLVKLYRTLSRDAVYANANGLTIFADNHDMSRVHTQLDHDPALTRMAVTLVATLRGIPQIFYGTEILMANPGTESHGVIRSDFPGGWPTDTSNGFTGRGLSEEALAMQRYTKQLLQWRKTASAIHNGQLRQYAPQAGVYCFFRYNEKERWLIATNKNSAATALDTARMAQDLDGYRYATALFSKQTQTLADGISLPARSVTVFRIH